MTEQFKMLSPREHVRERTGMYLGSTALETVERFVNGEWQQIKCVPALSKMIDEIIDNSIDEAIRTNFKHANQINVSLDLDKNTVTIEDNGRGIPQEDVITPEGKKIPRPVAAWTATNAGTSFEDDRTTIGANGVGSACTNFMSSKFVGTTWQNGNVIKVICLNGAEKTQVSSSKIGEMGKSGTKVIFTPDFSLLEVDSLSEGNIEQFILDRLTSLQIAFPEIRFKFNSRVIKESKIKQYSELFKSDPEASVVIGSDDNLSYFYASSEDGFRSNCYMNGVNCRLGGTYVDYHTNMVIQHLITMIKKKHKIEVLKSTIKSGLTFVMFARNFKDPKYDSQTKERLTSSVSSVKEHFESCSVDDAEKVAKRIMASEDIIGPIIEAQLAKKLAADKRAATMAQKKLRKAKVAKHISATRNDATLFLCEGDSAIGFLLKVRDPKTVGGYPLRGVVMNTWDMNPADVLKNKELSELIAILGLDINDPNSTANMNYRNVAILTDADHDGNHIAGLLIAFFYKFWPKLFEFDRIHLTRTPIMISEKTKCKPKWFYKYQDAKDFKSSDKSSGYKHRYIKGLASLTEGEYFDIINTPVLSTIKIDDVNEFEIMFGSNANLRKEWLK
jgi:DNA gyrase/topoisomerase IV subunit B